MRSTSFRPTSGLTARRVSRCSAPYTSGVSLRMALPPCATTRSPAAPRAGLALVGVGARQHRLDQRHALVYRPARAALLLDVEAVQVLAFDQLARGQPA